MHLSPQQIDAMSLWQYVAIVDGHNASHGEREPSQGVITDHDMMVGLREAHAMGTA